jgi:LPXTG-site transpeptidase (sortase) family protein
MGNLLVLTGLLVGTSVFLWPGGVPSPAAEPTDRPQAGEPAAQPIDQPRATELPTTTAPSGAWVVPALVHATPTPEPRLPITRIVITSIGLDSEVVPAPLVEKDGQSTWQVPAFSAGHAEDTAGAGQPGNAVLMGHISSLHSGDVFKDLDQVQVGDDVEVFSGERQFTYRVFDTRSVPRTDLAMVAPTSEPIVSLFTCTGAWNPVLWDYTERLFVRARLVVS